MYPPVKGLILAAGRGTRMGALTEEKPKCLVSFRGKPLIEYQIQSLKKAGISEIGIICGYKADLLFPYSSTHFINSNWETTNMVFSLLRAKEWLFNYDCIVSYSDIFYEPEVIKDLISNKDEVAISYDPNWLSLWSARFDNPLDDAETFKLDKHGYVVEIGNKPKTIKDIKGQYMGLLKFTPAFWSKAFDYVANIDQNISMTEFINILVQKGFRFKGIKNKMRWGEIDSPTDLKIYEHSEY